MAEIPSSPGISTSSRATSGRVRRAACDHLVAAADLGHDLEVALQIEQGGKAPRTSAWSSASSSRIALAHRAAPRRSRSRKPRPSSPRPTVSAAPAARARSRSPDRPWPGVGSARRRRVRRRAVGDAAAVVDHLDVVAADPHRAPRGAAVPHHVGDALAHGPAEQLPPLARHVVEGAGEVGRRCRPRSTPSARWPAPGQRHLAIAAEGRPHVGQGLARKPFQVSDLRARPGRVDLDQPAGQLGLDRDHGERVARGCRACRGPSARARPTPPTGPPRPVRSGAESCGRPPGADP